MKYSYLWFLNIVSFQFYTFHTTNFLSAIEKVFCPEFFKIAFISDINSSFVPIFLQIKLIRLRIDPENRVSEAANREHFSFNGLRNTAQWINIILNSYCFSFLHKVNVDDAFGITNNRCKCLIGWNNFFWQLFCLGNVKSPVKYLRKKVTNLKSWQAYTLDFGSETASPNCL